ncbi:hypothetical protein M569_10595, partial [Genlisea aurea]
SWNGLGNMASTEAMRLFVKILEEEDPAWYSRASDIVEEPIRDVEMNHNSEVLPVSNNGDFSPEPKTVQTENPNPVETQDKGVVSEGTGLVDVYDQWVAPPISGTLPKARYEHGAAVLDNKMYVFGGNHNGRYLNDLQVLDLRTWGWSKLEPQSGKQSTSVTAPCAGHSLIPWNGNKLLSVAGHTKDPTETLQVKEFNLQTCEWSTLKTYGKPPISRGGQSVTLVGTTLVIFGGQDAKRSLMNDLHILDLETMTWDEMETVGISPSPRSDHAAAVHEDRYLLIFGGGSHATCFNDLHVLDLQTMEWSKPTQQGEIPRSRAGHAGATIGDNWFIVGGGDNKSGALETIVLNMSTLVWSVVTTVRGRVPLASEGSSLVVSSYRGEDILVSFGGYNGRYTNEVNVLKPSLQSTSRRQATTETSLPPDSLSAVQNGTDVTADADSKSETGQIREIAVDDIDVESKKAEGTGERLAATIKAEKEALESSLSVEKTQAEKLKQELKEAESRSADLYKELQSVRSQLVSEQSRCFKLEVDVAELRQKLQTMETLQKELEILQRQKAASEQAALLVRQRQQQQRSGGSGVWGWLAGTP